MRPPGRPAPLRPLPDTTFRRLVVVSLVVGSNLPDVDLLYTSFAGGPLSYVLQHRGYTHTLVGALAGALVLWLLGLLWLRYRRLHATCAEQAWVAAACVIGVLLHLAMDYTNNYGVHPFWPFYNGWVYGDSVYILEPLLWLAAAPLIFVLESGAARVLVALAVGVMTLAVTLSGLVATPAVVMFLILAGTMLAVGRWLRPGIALGCGLALWLGVTAMFAVAGRVASGHSGGGGRQRLSGQPHARPRPDTHACQPGLLGGMAGAEAEGCRDHAPGPHLPVAWTARRARLPWNGAGPIGRRRAGSRHE